MLTRERLYEDLLQAYLEAEADPVHTVNALNSYCGVLSHWQSFKARQAMLLKRHSFTRYGGIFDNEVRHYYG